MLCVVMVASVDASVITSMIVAEICDGSLVSAKVGILVQELIVRLSLSSSLAKSVEGSLMNRFFSFTSLRFMLLSPFLSLFSLSLGFCLDLSFLFDNLGDDGSFLFLLVLTVKVETFVVDLRGRGALEQRDWVMVRGTMVHAVAILMGLSPVVPWVDAVVCVRAFKE